MRIPMFWETASTHLVGVRREGGDEGTRSQAATGQVRGCTKSVGVMVARFSRVCQRGTGGVWVGEGVPFGEELNPWSSGAWSGRVWIVECGEECF